MTSAKTASLVEAYLTVLPHCQWVEVLPVLPEGSGREANDDTAVPADTDDTAVLVDTGGPMPAGFGDRTARLVDEYVSVLTAEGRTPSGLEDIVALSRGEVKGSGGAQDGVGDEAPPLAPPSPSVKTHKLLHEYVIASPGMMPSLDDLDLDVDLKSPPMPIGEFAAALPHLRQASAKTSQLVEEYSAALAYAEMDARTHSSLASHEPDDGATMAAKSIVELDSSATSPLKEVYYYEQVRGPSALEAELRDFCDADLGSRLLLRDEPDDEPPSAMDLNSREASPPEQLRCATVMGSAPGVAMAPQGGPSRCQTAPQGGPPRCQTSMGCVAPAPPRQPPPPGGGGARGRRYSGSPEAVAGDMQDAQAREPRVPSQPPEAAAGPRPLSLAGSLDAVQGVGLVDAAREDNSTVPGSRAH